jgi:hypothetical protein
MKRIILIFFIFIFTTSILKSEVLYEQGFEITVKKLNDFGTPCELEVRFFNRYYDDTSLRLIINLINDKGINIEQIPLLVLGVKKNQKYNRKVSTLKSCSNVKKLDLKLIK